MDPEYTKLKAAPSVATVKSAAVPSIFSLFLATVKLLVSNVFAKSKNRTSSPTVGEAGKVIVKAPPAVLANKLSQEKLCMFLF